MSEPTLCQINLDDDCDGGFNAMIIESLIQSHLLVPVERCEHGRIDGHWISIHLMRDDEDPWCPGAGIGGKHE